VDSNHGHILVVDDNKINLMMLTRALNGQGYQVTTARDGQQALALLRDNQSGPVDVVLLDILMPEMDGFQLLEQIKRDNDLRHIPVIMISALDELDSVIRCIEMGATDYLHKPYNPAMLQARINASLAEKRLRDLELEYLEQVGHVVRAAEAVESARYDPGSLKDVAGREDALGQLARVFQRMANEVHLREQRLKQQLEQLHFDIEEMKRALAEPLSVYIPMDRRQALVRGESLAERVSGAALFADISGFTPLGEALAADLGRQRGAEELTRLLNQVYTALIGEVHRYHGSVVNFSGDAITCWIDGDGGQRALACGLAMQRSMERFVTIRTPTGSSFPMAIKVAVVVGPARRFLVGEAQIQNIEVLAGNTLDELAAAEHQARRGEVIAPGELVERFPEQLTIAEWRTAEETGKRYAVIGSLKDEVPSEPWPDLPVDGLSEERCRPWLLPAVYEQARSGAKSFLSELRPAGTLFLNFKGIDYDQDEQAGAKLDAFVRWVQTVISQYEGSLIQLTIGDKGSYLYAAFGAPVAHNDDILRAVYAALALQESPPEMEWVSGLQVGVTYGQMRTGAYGSPTQRTYGVMGDKVNLAARLMQVAEGGILCDEAVYQAAQVRLVFEALPPITVKGKVEPVAIYRPTGEMKRLDRSRASLIGRTSERIFLGECLRNLRRGVGSVVILEGEAGIGKSRLIEVVKGLAEGLQMETCLGLRVDRTSTSEVWDGCRDKTRDLLVRLLQEPRDEAPKVILLEDAQELDEESWGLVQATSLQVQSLLLVIATRPLVEPLPPSFAQLRRNSNLHTLRIKALSPDEAYLLACEHLGVVSLPEAVVEILHKAAGNPQFIEEMVYILRDDGTITVRDGECEVLPHIDLQAIAFPTTPQGVIKSRLDRLSPSEQLTLKVASVIGRTFSLRALQDAFPTEADKPYLGRHLAALKKLDLISQTSSDSAYTFNTELTYETVYNSMLFAQRRQLHRRAAEWIEHVQAADLAPFFAELADHWRKADDPAKAIDYLERAGQQALQIGQYQEAERYFKECLELDASAAVLSAEFFAMQRGGGGVGD